MPCTLNLVGSLSTHVPCASCGMSHKCGGMYIGALDRYPYSMTHKCTGKFPAALGDDRALSTWQQVGATVIVAGVALEHIDWLCGHIPGRLCTAPPLKTVGLGSWQPGDWAQECSRTVLG